MTASDVSTPRRMNLKIKTWKNWLLILVGIPSFLVSAYWLLVLGDIAPDLARDTNANGLSTDRMLAWLYLGGISIKAWAFGCLAARCNSILYERLFD